MNYRFYPKFSYRQAWANSVEPDQTPQNAASDQGLHNLPVIQYILNTFASTVDSSYLDLAYLE